MKIEKPDRKGKFFLKLKKNINIETKHPPR